MIRAMLLWSVMALGFAGAAAAEDSVGGRLQMSSVTGLSIASSKAAAQRTQIAIAPVGVQMQRGEISMRVSAPLVRIKGAGPVTGPNGEPLMARGGRRQGYGDVSVAAAWSRPNAAAGLDLSLSGQVKLATSPAAFGLGTGRTDYAVGVEVAAPLGEVTPFAKLGYRVFGDPIGQTLRDGPTFSLGASYQVRDFTVSLAHDYARSPLAGRADERDVQVSVSRPLAYGASVRAYGAAGLGGSIEKYRYGLMFQSPFR